MSSVPAPIAGKPYAELAALEAERCIPADIRKDCEVECFCPDESEFTFMNVYLPTVGSDFALSPNDSQNLIDRIDLSLESRFRNKLYPAGEFKNYLIKERLFDLHDSENTNDLLMATAMAKWDVENGATDSEHVARYHELMGTLKEELGIAKSKLGLGPDRCRRADRHAVRGGIGVDINLPDGKAAGSSPSSSRRRLSSRMTTRRRCMSSPMTGAIRNRCTGPMFTSTGTP